MVPGHQPVESECCWRPGGDHRAGPIVICGERFAVGAIHELELLPGTHERIIARLEREEHRHMARCVGPENQEVAVLRGADEHMCRLAGLEGVFGAQPHLDWGII
jgi:hypothetical protein